MNYVDLHELAVHRGTPAVSAMILCNDRWGCIAKIDVACTRAAHELRKRFPDDEGMQLAHKLELLRSRIAVSMEIRSVALFVNERIAWAYSLPYPVEDTVLVSTAFETTSLARHLCRAFRYWVLLLFHGKAFLFDGYEETIIEVAHRHTMETGEERVSLSDISGRVCGTNPEIWGRNCRYATMTEFIQSVDAALKHFFDTDPLPLICCADSETLAAFKRQSVYGPEILASLVIDRLHDRDDLQSMVYPVLSAAYKKLLKQDLVTLHEACDAGLCVQSVPHILQALQQGRVFRIYVTRGFSERGCELPKTGEIVAPEPCVDGAIVDGVTSVLELAAWQGVPIRFYPAGELGDFQNIAAIVESGEQE